MHATHTHTHRRKERDGRKTKQYQSILEMVDVDFLPSGELRMTQFMDGFPFPFYIVVNSLEEVCGRAMVSTLSTHTHTHTQLPTVLSDALAQWFEMAQSV